MLDVKTVTASSTASPEPPEAETMCRDPRTWSASSDSENTTEACEAACELFQTLTEFDAVGIAADAKSPKRKSPACPACPRTSAAAANSTTTSAESSRSAAESTIGCCFANIIAVSTDAACGT